MTPIPADLLVGPFVAIRPELVRRLDGDMNAAVVWSLIAYRTQLDEHRDGWSATYALLASETGMTERKIERAIKALRDRGWLTWQRTSWDDATNKFLPTSPETGGSDQSPETGSCISPETGGSDSPETGESFLIEELSKNKEEERCDDATRCARLLAARIHNNGSRKPTVTRAWITSIDRMHRLDGRTWDEIEGAIRWSQSHDFWATVVLSPQKLRSNFDQMRLQSQRRSRQPGQRQTDADILAMADRL